MSPAEVRDALERTGVLFTQHEDDPGHIPAFWRKAVLALCDAFDDLPRDAAELLHQERAAHAATRADFARAVEVDVGALAERERSDRARAQAEDDLRVATQLVAEAIPRMRTLNNAMSPGWLERASALLGE